MGRSLRMDFLVVDRKQRESFGVIEVALLRAEEEEPDRAPHQDQAHEHLEDQDFHDALPRIDDMRAVVQRTVVTELTGMRTAQRSGVICPANASVTVMAL